MAMVATEPATVHRFAATLTAERYIAKEKYSAYEVSQPSTALVAYKRVSFGIDYSF